MSVNIEYREINGHDFLVVDELIFDPRYEGRTVARIGEDYILFRVPTAIGDRVTDFKPYIMKPSPDFMRFEWNHDFHLKRCVPREGFRRKGKWQPDIA
jgi:hypothetical protein